MGRVVSTADSNLNSYREKMCIINNPFDMQDLLRMCIGSFISAGEYRSVFDWDLKPGVVVKYCHGQDNLANWSEYSVWQSVKDTDYAKWFCPIIGMSPCGSFLLMKKARPIKETDKLPKNIPNFFEDVHPRNFGLIGKQLVCVDYQFMSRAFDLASNTKARKVNWKELFLMG